MKKRIGILTSGGDAPGMNAAIRAVVLASAIKEYEVIGFFHGYNGLINSECSLLDKASVDNIIHLGGTTLKSARCPELKTEEGFNQAINTLIKLKIDALIVVGGDGSFTGLSKIAEHWDGQVIGLPGTIDNDLDGTDLTIGFSTAINTAINAIDKIRDTANAFDRVFVVELMGRHSGHIAFHVGIATGAEQIISFENFHHGDTETKVAEIIKEVKQSKENKDASYLIVIAENLWPGGVTHLSNALASADIDTGTCILGHIQRGGSPVAKDRILATKLGVEAIQAIEDGKTNIMIGEINNEVSFVPLVTAIQHTKNVAENMVAAHKDILAFGCHSNR
ncbi:ATP-dependent 6-phosphofructokinase [Thalassotalea euphylliae]|uniref:ATP-dependent 6-phosphofructokinase n=1 Tax=Thalassotalea euphylliae TaxID=1655234 RepID=UPI0036358D4E